MSIKNSIGLYKKDIKEIKGNWVLMIIIVGLMIIPPLYAWFNIKAFWDPYSQAKNIKVAVVNLDKEVEFKNQKFLIGNNIVDAMKENKALDWQFVSKENAQKGLNSGKYFAIIEIPESFTEDLLSVTRADVKKATINYSVNEKINAIAPKITDKGTDTLKNNISQNLIKTVSGISIGAAGGVSNVVGDIGPKLDVMKKDLQLLSSQLANAKQLSSTTGKSMEDLQAIMTDVRKSLPGKDSATNGISKLTTDLGNINKEINKSFNSIIPTVKQDINLVGNILGQTSDLMDSLGQKGKLLNEDVISILSRVDSKLNHSIDIMGSVINVLKRYNIFDLKGVNAGISSLENYLKTIKSTEKLVSDTIVSVKNGGEISGELAGNISKALGKLNRESVDVLANFDDKIANPINKLANSSGAINQDINTIIGKINGVYPTIDGFISKAEAFTNTMKAVNVAANGVVDTLSSQTDSLIKKIESLENNKEYKDFNEVIKSNILERIDFLKEPVTVKENIIYPIKNYGSAMTPFYSVLASWVGGLVLAAVLATNSSEKSKPLEGYFGRLLLFWTIAVIQATNIALGNFFILGVTAQHPVLFWAILVFCSIVFTAIIYSLVSVFGTVGKAISIFLLVIQIGGSGGTFPVEMTPMFFRSINKIIPFTYGISACREAVGGVYWQNLKGDLLALFIFLAIAILFSIFFKEKINNKVAGLKKKLHDSFLFAESE